MCSHPTFQHVILRCLVIQNFSILGTYRKPFSIWRVFDTCDFLVTVFDGLDYLEGGDVQNNYVTIRASNSQSFSK
jgi:hypothetical protein